MRQLIPARNLITQKQTTKSKQNHASNVAFLNDSASTAKKVHERQTLVEKQGSSTNLLKIIHKNLPYRYTRLHNVCYVLPLYNI